MEEKISIVVPIYNCEKYLQDCIESLINQDYNNLEIILINDGSTDSSDKICKFYQKKDKRIIYYNKKNTGVSDTRNLGINSSTGKYVLFVDSDDLIESNCVSLLVKSLKKNYLSICKIKKFSINPDFKVKDTTFNKKIFDCSKYFEIYKLNLLNPPYGRLYELSILKNNAIKFKKDLSLGEDLVFNMEYLKYVKGVVLLDNELYDYRVGNVSSLSQKYYPNMCDIQIELMNSFIDFFGKNVDNDILQKECIKFINAIVSNEFHNKNANIFNKIKNMIKVLNKNEVQKEIISRKKYFSKTQYFLLKLRLYHLYLLNFKLERSFK